jgi:hypothetical protein
MSGFELILYGRIWVPKGFDKLDQELKAWADNAKLAA